MYLIESGMKPKEIHLPRVCGGVPRKGDCNALFFQFTPRLRRCTYWCSKFAYIEVIYPASAGVYLIESGMKPKEIHLPRARGDVPLQPIFVIFRLLFTPRLRGCTSGPFY